MTPRFATRPTPAALAFLLIAVLVGAGAGCSGKSEDGGPAKGADVAPRHGLSAEQAAAVLVRVGDTKITLGQFADELAEQSPYLRARYNSPERRKEYLDSLVRFELLAAEARRKGFFDKDEVRRTEKQAMIQQMMRVDFDEKFKLADISDADIKAFYESHLAEYKKPEQIRLAHIVAKNRSTAQQILGQILAAPKDDALFKKIAGQHNEDPTTKDTFGDLGFLSKPGDRAPGEVVSVADSVIEAGYKLAEIGDVSKDLVESPAGFHVVKLVAKRPPLTRTLEEARRTIQDRLRRERRDGAIEALIKELRAKASVKEDMALLAQIKVDAPPTAPHPAPHVSQAAPGQKPAPAAQPKPAAQPEQ